MEAYTEFARVYDKFMEETPYKKWSGFLINYMSSQGIYDGLVLDLGCGTGKLTRLLARAGYDMIGVDNSVEMLDIARNCGEEGILYLAQDMREFELYGTVRAIVSSCDCINYILEEEDMVKVFSLANNYLDSKGIFIFDFNTRLKYEGIGDRIIAENQEDASFIWENFYYPDEKINEYDVTFFLKEKGNLYRKIVEEHFQRAYTLEEIKTFIKKAGMEFVDAFEDYTDKPADDMSERICIVARECGK